MKETPRTIISFSSGSGSSCEVQVVDPLGKRARKKVSGLHCLFLKRIPSPASAKANGGSGPCSLGGGHIQIWFHASNVLRCEEFFPQPFITGDRWEQSMKCLQSFKNLPCSKRAGSSTRQLLCFNCLQGRFFINIMAWWTLTIKSDYPHK